MNRKWIEEDGIYKLLFIPYDDFLEYAAIKQDRDGDWIIVSGPLNIEYDILDAETIEAAKEEVEYKIREAFEDKIAYYENLIELFEAE